MATPNFTVGPRVAHNIIYIDAGTTYSGAGHPVTGFTWRSVCFSRAKWFPGRLGGMLGLRGPELLDHLLNLSHYKRGIRLVGNKGHVFSPFNNLMGAVG